MSSLRKRASLLDAASVVAGAAFIGVTGFLAAGTALWALMTMAGLPPLAVTWAEAAAAALFVVLSVVIVRRGLRLAAEEAALFG